MKIQTVHLIPENHGVFDQVVWDTGLFQYMPDADFPHDSSRFVSKGNARYSFGTAFEEDLLHTHSGSRDCRRNNEVRENHGRSIG